MKISIITLFPKMFKGPFDESIIKKAREKNLIDIKFIDLRNFGIGNHKSVDDTPYGGGVGMILRVDVLKAAIDSAIDPSLAKNKQKVVLLSAAGRRFDQKKAKQYSQLSRLVLICGHYEGVDYRVRKFVDEEVCLGDFVLTGGEIAAMALTDAVSRLVKGVLKDDATSIESFSKGLLEHPQYTKPSSYDRLRVPKILLLGDHKKIRKWREKQSAANTKKMRPDLLKRI